MNMTFHDMDKFIVGLMLTIWILLLIFLLVRTIDQKKVYVERKKLAQSSLCYPYMQGDLLTVEYMLTRTRTYYNSYFSFKILDWICNLTSIILAIYTLKTENDILPILSILFVVFVIFLKFNERSRDYLKAWRESDFVILPVLNNLKTLTIISEPDEDYMKEIHLAILDAMTKFQDIECSIVSDET